MWKQLAVSTETHRLLVLGRVRSQPGHELQTDGLWLEISCRYVFFGLLRMGPFNVLKLLELVSHLISLCFESSRDCCCACVWPQLERSGLLSPPPEHMLRSPLSTPPPGPLKRRVPITPHNIFVTMNLANMFLFNVGV